MPVMTTQEDFEDIQDLVDWFIKATVLQSDGEALTEDEQELYLDCATLIMVQQFMRQGLTKELAVSIVERIMFDENDEAREVTINAKVEHGVLVNLSLTAADDDAEVEA